MMSRPTCPLKKRHKFNLHKVNSHTDVPSKVAALKVSKSVVSLVSYSGDQQVFECSGTIIESDNASAIVLTSAYLLKWPLRRNKIGPNIKVVVHTVNNESFDGHIMGCDFHYHIAAIKIYTNTRLPPAILRFLNDSLPVDTSRIPMLLDRKSFGLQQHSDSFDIIPGSSVICVGRYFKKPYELMAAHGVLSLERCDYDCKELFMTTCNITRCGIGGPLINSFGDVIGICFYEICWTPFLPINIALTWWEQFKKHGLKLRPPRLGMELRKFCSTSVAFLDKITQKFPNTVEGAFVMEVKPRSVFKKRKEKVKPRSPAEAAGIKNDDVIIQFGGKAIRSSLEVMVESWKRIGEVVEVVVLRKSEDHPVHLSLLVKKVTRAKFYRWLVWENVP